MLLLVLDNIEHLLEAAGLLAEILEQSSQVKLLVTSRERLNRKMRTGPVTLAAILATELTFRLLGNTSHLGYIERSDCC